MNSETEEEEETDTEDQIADVDLIERPDGLVVDVQNLSDADYVQVLHDEFFL